MTKRQAEAAVGKFILAGFGLVPRGFYRRPTQLAIDGCFAALAVWAAFNLRFDFNVPVWAQPAMHLWILLAAILRPMVLLFTRAYRSIWRYFNHYDALIFLLAASPFTLVLLTLRFTLNVRSWYSSVPLSVCLIDALVFAALGLFVRSLRRLSYEFGRGSSSSRLRALIIGSEHTLPGALRQVSSDPEIEIVGIIAPHKQLHGFTIGGVEVIPEVADLARVLVERAVKVVLVADPDMDTLSHTVATVSEFGIEIRLLPSASTVISGKVRVSTPPSVDMAVMERGVALASPCSEVQAAFGGRCVLVSGAGGSIGSEICRQLMNLGIRKIILLDQDENSIFERNNELKKLESKISIVPLVGDIRDEQRLRRIFTAYEPQIVLHAAAYKHVPVMEANCSEAILNNVMGTRLLAELAATFGCERFLMISTDKAVNPVSVMGASKRAAELAVQRIAARERLTAGKTRFSCVRFGNVVGSRGSVVPIFLQQIAAGGPLTITDEEMTRYFMTIPEAVQLVLQACSLGEQGEIYILDMGDPIKIKNLARKLIEMSGLRADKDIEIRVVGMRPGEKLHEDLWPEDADVSRTLFDRVFAIQVDPPDAEFDETLQQLESAAHDGNDQKVRDALFALLGTRQTTRAAAAGVVD
jgi:FlaA1/EpsC-like NDP-sugar epimerase